MPNAVFEAMIVPHRSMGQNGLRWVAGSLATLSTLVAVGLWAVGAWPVIGFTGLEAGAAIWLVRRHALGPRGSELLVLSDAGLRIVTTDRRGRREERSLSAAWLRAELEDRPGRVPALVLRDRNKVVEVATALGETEKRDLSESLKAALERYRHPVFDNAQLREISFRQDPST